jgi:hypothetical protein
MALLSLHEIFRNASVLFSFPFFYFVVLMCLFWKWCWRQCPACSGNMTCFQSPSRVMQDPIEPSCCLCGKKGHTGQLNDCPEGLPKVLTGELAGESSRSRNRGNDRAPAQHARSVAHEMNGGGHAGPSHYAPREVGEHSRLNSRGAVRDYDPHALQAHEYGQRAPRVVPAAAHGYGPNSRHGYREVGREAAAAPRPMLDWGTAQRTDWQRDAAGGLHASRGHAHGDGCQRISAQQPPGNPVVMHPPPDQIGVHHRVPQPQVLHLPPGTVILNAPRVHAASPQVQQQPGVFAPRIHVAGGNAPPPDVQPIQRYSYDVPRMAPPDMKASSARREDDLMWRGQHVGGTAGLQGGSIGSRSAEYRQRYDRNAEPYGRERSYRRY